MNEWSEKMCESQECYKVKKYVGVGMYSKTGVPC